MAKILQVRRGDAAHNDNFTGLPGEITVDTDANTLRVHDGVTLGGHALARADQIPVGGDGDFDISSVPDEFWAGIVAKFAPAGNALVHHECENIPINPAASAMAATFQNIGPIIMARAFLVCTADDAGYCAGDVVSAFGIGARANPAPNVYNTDFGQKVQIFIGGEKFWASHPGTGVTTEIDPERWAVRFSVWC